MSNKAKKIPIPSLAEIQHERKRIRRAFYYRQALRGTVSVLVVVAAVVLLLLCVFRKKMLTRTHGMIMLAGYVGYFAYLMV